MGKNKLAKFEDMAGYPHVFQYPFSVLQEKGFEKRGRWNELFFHNDHPIVLELGCGKGEYTVGLGRLFPEKNFIGIDIKGARMWTGAKASLEAGMTNIAFLRTNIELISHFFAPGEVSEIWITFPDPQMKKVNKRLTSTRFMRLYREILADNGQIHLKTDSDFLFTYTREMIKANQLPVLFETNDLSSPSRPITSNNGSIGDLTLNTSVSSAKTARSGSSRTWRSSSTLTEASTEANEALWPQGNRRYELKRRVIKT